MSQAWDRFKLAIAQGVGRLIGDKKLQAEFMDGEPLDNVFRIEPYGLSYRPKAGCQVYALFPNGDRTNGLALVIGDKRYQMTLAEGEVGLHDDLGNWVHIKRGGVIEVKASSKVIADTPLVETTGDLHVNGKITSDNGYYGAGGGAAQMQGGAQVTGVFTVNGKNVSDSHTHGETGGHTLGVD